MRFPFVLRVDHEEIVTELRAQNEILRTQYEQLYDSMMLEKCGVQMFGTFPPEVVEAMKPKEQPVTPAPAVADVEPLTEEDDDLRELTSIGRTNPSQVGARLSRLMLRRSMKQALAARPSQFMKAVERSGTA